MHRPWMWMWGIALVAAGCAANVDEPVGGSEAALGDHGDHAWDHGGGWSHDDWGWGRRGFPRNLDRAVRRVAHAEGLEGFPHLDRDLDAQEQAIVDKRARLGQLLFYDRALSGVNHTSCATCHHAAFMYTDGRNIARGVFCERNADGSQIFCDDPPSPEDGDVVGPARTSPLNERNTPSPVNSALFPRQMANGRFHFVDESSKDVNELDPSLGFDVQPPDPILFTRSLLGAQAFKPVPSPIEMAGDWPDIGQPFDSEPSRTFRIQAGLAARINAIAEYRAMFDEAYAPGTEVFDGDPILAPEQPLTFTQIGDAIAQFQENKLVLTNAPWDHFLTGEDDAIDESAKRGAWIFFARERCSSCHSGDLFSDFENYNIGVPQVGPGTGRSDPSDSAYEGLATWDFGAEEFTHIRSERFAFRTPPLRGVTLTPPYMHNGAYTRLEDAILHHVNPRRSYATYDISQIEPDMQAADGVKPMGPVFDRRNPVAVGPGTDHRIGHLSDRDVQDLIAFLRSLTDPHMRNLADLVPAGVPSGLPVDVVGPAVFPTYE